MAQITAGLVKELRERTGAGMMDCKKALRSFSNSAFVIPAIPFSFQNQLCGSTKITG